MVVFSVINRFVKNLESLDSNADWYHSLASYIGKKLMWTSNELLLHLGLLE